jgi:DNA-binding LacI/PurR family transcriptional regulator
VARDHAYRRIADAILRRIRDGEWPEGSLLAPEVELARQYAVGRSTVREAMRTLESLGWVERRQGAGTFVRRGRDDTGRTFVGLVVAHLDDLRLAGTLGGLEEVLQGAGVALEVRATQDEPAAEAAAVESLRREGAAGVLLEPAPGWPSRGTLARCLAEGFPVGCLDRYDPELALPYAVADHRRGALELARHLLVAGHQRIAFILPRSFPTTSLQARWQGYLDALREAGVPPDPDLSVRIEGQLEEPLDDALRTTLNRLMALPAGRRPTALMCPNDEIASWALGLLKEAGVRVPEECSVAGFDDLPYAAHVHPALTTVRQPLRAIGRAAAAGLLARMHRPADPPVAAVLPTRLVVRASTGRAPAPALAPTDSTSYQA